MAERLTAPQRRPGLATRQKKALTRLDKKTTLTPFEEGQLRAFAYFGDPTDAQRAAAILTRHQDKENQS